MHLFIEHLFYIIKSIDFWRKKPYFTSQKSEKSIAFFLVCDYNERTKVVKRGEE
jgi:hypothetical protein